MIVKNLDEMILQLQNKGYQIEITMSIIPPQEGLVARVEELTEKVKQLTNASIMKG